MCAVGRAIRAWDETRTADGAPARELVVSVGRVMNVRLAEITEDLVGRLSSEIDRLPGDEGLLQLMAASIEANVDTLVHVLRHEIEVERTEAPAAAVEYARRLAQRGIPVNALVRAYRLGQDSYLRWCLEEVRRQSNDAEAVSAAALHIVATTSAYIDRATQRVVRAYEEERDLWLLNRSASRSARIRELLAEGTVDIAATENTLGYRLRQHHLGLVVWAEKSDARDDQLTYLERSVTALAEQLGCAARPLFVPCDELSAWGWLPFGAETAVDHAMLAEIVAGWERRVRVATGIPRMGFAGFRRTHQQALQAQVVALAAHPRIAPVTSFAEVGPMALMCSDLEAARGWVVDTIGPLAVDDGPRARLRETVHAFLSSGGSYIAAAERLRLHKNSVVYRLRKAEETLGRPLREDRLQLELALSLCHWLGPAVLTTERETHAASGD